MTSPTPVTPQQQVFRDAVAALMQAVNAGYDNPNPTPHDQQLIQLLMFALNLANDPARLELYLKVVRAFTDSEKSATLTVLLDEMDAGSSEYEFVKYVLQGNGGGMPLWSDVSAKLFEIAIRDEAAQSTSAAPTTAPPAAAPAAPAQPPAQNFQDAFGGLFGNGAAAPAAQPQPTPTPAPPAQPTQPAPAPPVQAPPVTPAPAPAAQPAAATPGRFKNRRR